MSEEEEEFTLSVEDRVKIHRLSQKTGRPINDILHIIIQEGSANFSLWKIGLDEPISVFMSLWDKGRETFLDPLEAEVLLTLKKRFLTEEEAENFFEEYHKHEVEWSLDSRDLGEISIDFSIRQEEG